MTLEVSRLIAHEDDGLVMKSGQARKVLIEIRKVVVLARVDVRVDRDEIPKEIMCDERPWQEVIERKGIRERTASVDINEAVPASRRNQTLADGAPEPSCWPQVPLCLGVKFVDDPRNVRVVRLQVLGEMQFTEGGDQCHVLD